MNQIISDEMKKMDDNSTAVDQPPLNNKHVINLATVLIGDVFLMFIRSVTNRITTGNGDILQ
jgi:hypothetical protein